MGRVGPDRRVHQCVIIVDEFWSKTNRNRITRSEDDVRGVASSDKKTEQERSMVRFACGRDASTSCGGCEEETVETQAPSEGGLGNTEVREQDPNLVGLS